MLLLNAVVAAAGVVLMAAPAHATSAGATVTYEMKLEKTLAWTAADKESFDDWHKAADRPGLYEEFGFDWSTDYCTSGPDRPAGFDFRLPCRRHDFGYRNFRDLDVFAAHKARVDTSFLADMKRVCGRERFGLKQVCNAIAATYYRAVVAFGQGPSTRRDSF